MREDEEKLYEEEDGTSGSLPLHLKRRNNDCNFNTE